MYKRQVDESNKRRGFFSINAIWKNKIAVLCEADKVDEAKKAGADIAGSDDLLEKKVKCQSEVSSIEPKFFMKDGKMIGLLPGDEGYEDH